VRLIAKYSLVAFLTASACGKVDQAPDVKFKAQQKIGKSMSKSSSRIPAPKITPIVIGHIRIEQVTNGFTAGLDQMGGYIAAYDTENNKLLWTLKVYENARNLDKEGDVQDVFFKTMTLESDGNILIENEKRKRFTVNINDKSVVELQ
jgi:hypothetical protein